MKNQDYRCSFMADVPPKEAFDGINDVSGWWAKSFEGSSTHLNDVFTVHFGKTHVDFQVTEFVPNKVVEWKVMDCHLDWIKAKKEWNGTSVRFEISREGEKTKVSMTHVGLTESAECYADCEKGWNGHFGESLLKLLNEHAGMPI
jgi:hypothetical protein